MILYPAIDIQDTVCVRLTDGDVNKATVYHKNPEEQAKLFALAGCEWLHIIDLNGAVEGRVVNSSAVSKIITQVDTPIQLGGGIRSLDMIEKWLELGVARVVLATSAVRDPEFMKAAAKEFPGQIVVSIDAKDGHVAISGWTQTSNITVNEFAQQVQDAGVAAVIYTDINRDGTMAGINIEDTAGLAEMLNIPVIAAGGIGTLDDLRALKDHEARGISGVICGKAFYDHQIDPEEAIRILKS